MLVAQMRRAPIFSHLTEQQCNEVAACMVRVPFSEGDLIGPVQNEPTTSLYVLVEGTVVRYRDTRIVDETVSRTDRRSLNTVIRSVHRTHAGRGGAQRLAVRRTSGF